jgi:hypothetical protein
MKNLHTEFVNLQAWGEVPVVVWEKAPAASAALVEVGAPPLLVARRPAIEIGG